MVVHHASLDLEAKSTQKLAIDLGTVKKTANFPCYDINFNLTSNKLYDMLQLLKEIKDKRLSYVFMIFRAITSFLSASNSSSCFFLC